VILILVGFRKSEAVCPRDRPRQRARCAATASCSGSEVGATPVTTGNRKDVISATVDCSRQHRKAHRERHVSAHRASGIAW
jgi:hypothetical protein